MQIKVVPQKVKQFVSEKTREISSSIPVLRSKLLWQKMTGKKESIIKETRIKLADAYFERAGMQKTVLENSRKELGSALKTPADISRHMDGENDHLIMPRIEEKLRSWRAAVAYSKAAKYYSMTKKFQEAGVAWEYTAEYRHDLAMLNRFGLAENYNYRKNSKAQLKSGEAYRNAGNIEKSEEMLRTGMIDAAYRIAEVWIPIDNVTISTNLTNAKTA